jgi:phosphatidylglycerophosphatase A
MENWPMQCVGFAMATGMTASWLLIFLLLWILFLAASGNFRTGFGGNPADIKETLKEKAAELIEKTKAEAPAPSIRKRLRITVWLAQGFGIGRIPLAPGTFGSVLGVAWFALLLSEANWWTLAIASTGGILCSVFLCDVAERVLNQKDPGSVVFDEIAAIPFCFFGWMAIFCLRYGHLPDLELVFVNNWQRTLGIFLLFRLFDVAKPWPVRQSQSLRGGWGVTIDDLLAAVYVNVVVVAVWGVKQMLQTNS